MSEAEAVLDPHRRAAFITPVSVGTIDGGMLSGRITPFNPNLPNLILQEGTSLPKGLGRQRPKHYIEAERVTYVAFHKEKGAPPARLMIADPTALRIHVSGGSCFEVRASASKLNDMLGFYAFPVEADSPYEHFYFYASGINARESVELLGQMLIEDGGLGGEKLKLGIEQQLIEQQIPIGQLLVQQTGLTNDQVEEATQLQERRRLRIGEVLIEQGLITQEELTAALESQGRKRGKRVGEVLVEMGILEEKALFRTLARKFHMPFIDLSEVNINPAALKQIGPELMRKYNVLPLDVTGTCLTIAIPDPLNTEAQDVLRFQCKLRIKEVLATPTQLSRSIAELFTEVEDDSAVQEIIDLLEGESARSRYHDDDDEEGDSAIIRLVDQIIHDAYKRGVSDIHIEPNGPDKNILIRFRIDGQCVVYQTVPPSARHAISTRIKILAELNIAERRLPQDGKIKTRIDGQKVELRVATLPTVSQDEDVVMRILASSEPLPLDLMGFNDRNLREVQSATQRPYGLILCVGPTGSGKTTTLHSALGYINNTDRKIWTAEDPVEITQPGLRQVQVKASIGFTFAAAMRSFLRADPDVIMIGEMRDHETAATAVEASLTGHLVFSTLHTNSAPETVTRLLDMGLDPFSFADALLIVLAQRLTRRLCKHCRRPYVASEAEYDNIIERYGEEALRKRQGVVNPGDLQLWKADGCRVCEGSGYKGRVALHELLTSNEALKSAIQAKAPAGIIRREAMAGGMTTLMQDGIDKCIDGKTDMSRVLAVCSV